MILICSHFQVMALRASRMKLAQEVATLLGESAFQTVSDCSTIMLRDVGVSTAVHPRRTGDFANVRDLIADLRNSMRRHLPCSRYPIHLSVLPIADSRVSFSGSIPRSRCRAASAVSNTAGVSGQYFEFARPRSHHSKGDASTNCDRFDTT
jgi:hypothetical protein